MPDLKISQLPVATTPLAGTELVPIVQGGVTDQTTVAAILTGTVPSGTANGVLYLNGSKVVTSGSGLTFDGTNFATTGAATGLRLVASSTDAGGSVLQVDTTATAYGRVGGSTTMGYVAGTQSLWTIGGSEQMRLTSMGLGIGTNNPTQKLHVLTSVAGAAGAIIDNASTDSAAITRLSLITQFGGTWSVDAASSSGQLRFGNGTDRVILDSSGNLGLGVTPSAWSSVVLGLQIRNSSISGTTSQVFVSNNSYYNSGWKYVGTGISTMQYAQETDGHKWFTAPSGTAGNPISFTQAMTLDASGNLGIGETSPNSYGKFIVSGSGIQASINATSGTARLNFYEGANNRFGLLTLNGSAGLAFVDTSTAIERARITSAGNVSIGGTVDRATTVGTAALNIFNGTAPAGTLANGISIYSDAGEAYVMDAAGNATLFSPHDRETNEWIFKSTDTTTGKVLRIDVERLLRFVNDHFGLDAVKEFTV